MDAVNTTTTETPEIKLHFLDYWRVIRLRKSLILTVFLLCVIASAFLTYWLPKQYSSTVEMEVQKDDPPITIIGNSANQSWDPVLSGYPIQDHDGSENSLPGDHQHGTST